MLVVVVGATGAPMYSFHSCRIFLACSLLASGATGPQIMALCRWQTEESLAIYARMNPETANALLTRSLRADVTSVSSANIPVITGQSTLRELFAVADKELSDAAYCAASSYGWPQSQRADVAPPEFAAHGPQPRRRAHARPAAR